MILNVDTNSSTRYCEILCLIRILRVDSSADFQTPTLMLLFTSNLLVNISNSHEIILTVGGARFDSSFWAILSYVQKTCLNFDEVKSGSYYSEGEVITE